MQDSTQPCWFKTFVYSREYIPLPGPPAEKDPPPPRRVCRVAKAYISGEEIGRASKEMWTCESGIERLLTGGGSGGSARNPPV